jgi:hypothetical protein
VIVEEPGYARVLHGVLTVSSLVEEDKLMSRAEIQY